jgi:hypothetical protein
LSFQFIDFSNSYSGGGSWSWEWTISDYTYYISGTYTFSISVATSSSDFPAFLYMNKASGSASGYSIIAGFQSQGGTSSSLPILSLLWNLGVSDAFYTETYFIGAFGQSSSGPFFGPTFELEVDIADEAPCRFYTEGGYS